MSLVNFLDTNSHVYIVKMQQPGLVQLVTPVNPLSLVPVEMQNVPLFLTFEPALLTRGTLRIKVIVQNESGFSTELPISLLGPG